MSGWSSELIATLTWILLGVLGLALAADQVSLMMTVQAWLGALP